MKKVEISWLDSHRYTYQMSPQEAVSIITIVSCGFLVSQNKTQVVICQDNIEGDIRGVLVIPMVNILKMKVFK